MVASLEAASVALPTTSLLLGSAVHISSLGLYLDNHAWIILGVWNSVLLLSFGMLAPIVGLVSAAQHVLSFAISFLSGYFGSMAIYRLFFSPIRNFPGPRLAALTSFYRVHAAIRSNIRLFTQIEDLHKRYGDYVRVGPREISILNPAAIPLLYGAKTRCRRGPWYNHIRGKEEDKHVLLTADPASHSWRRRIMDKGFSNKGNRRPPPPLIDYEPRIQRTIDDLIEGLEARAGTPVDMTDWVNFFSFDAMGRIAYNLDFGMLKRGEGYVEVDGRSTSLKALHAAMKAFGIIGPVPWLFRMISQTGGGGGEISTFFQWCNDAIRMKQKTFDAANDTPKDIASHILAAQHSATDPSKRQTQRSIENTSSLLILAGSDTSASAITNTLFYLACDVSRRAKLRSLLSALPTRPSARDLATVPYLDHVINETLRLKPPACEGLTRETPPQGLELPDGRFVPAATVVSVPTWALHRDPRFWGPDPADWRPERFEGVDLTAETLPFVPFTRGACACPGKQLAYVEMRAVVAAVVRGFEVEFAEGQGVREFDEGCIDSFTLTCPPLMLVLKKREG